MTARRSGLKDAYDAVSSDVPVFGDVDLAIRTARRRRLRTAIGVPLLAAAAAAAVVLSASLPRWSAEPDPSGTSQPVTVTFLEWMPNAASIGSPAEPGSLLYRDCATCPLNLRRPDGRSFPLAGLRPDVADKVPASGLGGVYLSYDGRWLGLPRGTAYELYDLAATGSAPRVLPAGPSGSRWKPVGAGLTYAFARYQGARVTTYAFVDPLRPFEISDDLPTTYDRLPVRAPYGSVVDAKPVAPGVRVTEVGTSYLATLTYDDASKGPAPGTRGTDWSPGNFGAGLRADETLAGPSGVPVVAEPPTSHNDDSGVWQVATVFVERGGTVVPSGVLRLGMDDPVVRRIDVPAGWELLGPMDRDVVAVGRRTGDGYEVVGLGFDGSRRGLQRLGPDAEVLLPGTAR